ALTLEATYNYQFVVTSYTGESKRNTSITKADRGSAQHIIALGLGYSFQHSAAGVRMTALVEIGRIPLPQGAYQWHVLADVDVAVFMAREEWFAHSLISGQELWRRDRRGMGADDAAQVIGSNLEIVVVQESRRRGSNRWLEGVVISTGETAWRKAESPP